MQTISFNEIEAGEILSLEIWVAGHRRITISLAKDWTSLQIPTEIKPESIFNRPGSFYVRTGDPL